MGNHVLFTFAWPLSIDALLVVATSGELHWVLLASEHGDFNVSLGPSVWPIDQAPPEVVLNLSRTPYRYARDLRGTPPKRPALSRLTYGESPAGYYSRVPAKSLVPADYAVIVQAEQGGGSSNFSVPSSPNAESQPS
jgi:hypothetical protein